MRTEEYLEILTGQIRCRMAREEVAEEVRAHIEDQTRAFMSEGIERGEAELLAVREMGDPVEAGNELDKVHRPRMPWGMLSLIAVLSIFGYLAQYLLEQKIFQSAGASLNVYACPDLQKQLLFVVIGFALMVGVCFFDYTRISKRARELLIGLSLCTILGTSILGVSVNGAQRWIGAGIFHIDATMLLQLTVPLYAAVLYQYRGESWKAVGKAVLWMIPGFGISMKYSTAWMAAVLLVTYTVVLGVAVYRGWFRVPKRGSLAAAGAVLILLPAAGIYACFAAGAWGVYHWDRLRAMFGLESEVYHYPVHFAREWIAGSRLLGEGEHLPDAADILSPADSALAGIAGYYGILAALAVAGVLLFLLFRFLHISLKQRNQLGMLMGTGCAVVFLIQALIYIANNLGIFYVGNFCPFLTSGGSGTMITYILLGILLSICRYQNTAPERRRAVSAETALSVQGAAPK